MGADVLVFGVVSLMAIVIVPVLILAWPPTRMLACIAALVGLAVAIGPMWTIILLLLLLLVD